MRRFLFLQGPHGPFFRQLAARLRQGGSMAFKIGINGGDALFWGRAPGYIPFRGGAGDWTDFLTRTLDTHQITDIVLYGEGRSVHDTAVQLARERGLTTHIFEEGYLRPYWVTYERDGSNGRSPLCQIPLAAMAQATGPGDAPRSAAGWGELKQHIFYGAVYHGALMAGRLWYPRYAGHRDISVGRETLLNVVRFLTLPLQAAERRVATARLRLGGHPYHLVLLQLEHDASFRGHAPYARISEFVDEVVEGFAEGAPEHHHLVFKAHPLEDGRANVRRAVRAAARRLGVAARVHFLHGGKLAGLLDDALSAVTINSTAGQQVLRRGIPLKAMGEAVYSGRGFTSNQAMAAFFADPIPPDGEAYALFRRYQLETCQVPGGFYSARGRGRLLRRIVDRMLSENGPYAIERNVSLPQRTLRVVAQR